jgi:hypothetical protein
MDEINKAGKRLLGKSYLGTFMLDTRPQHIKRGQCYIFNNLKAGTRGQHWLGVIKGYDNKLYGYDSLGQIAIDGLIMSRSGAEQASNESSCGQRTLTWLLLAKVYTPSVVMKYI